MAKRPLPSWIKKSFRPCPERKSRSSAALPSTITSTRLQVWRRRTPLNRCRIRSEIRFIRKTECFNSSNICGMMADTGNCDGDAVPVQSCRYSPLQLIPCLSGSCSKISQTACHGALPGESHFSVTGRVHCVSIRSRSRCCNATISSSAGSASQCVP